MRIVLLAFYFLFAPKLAAQADIKTFEMYSKTKGSYLQIQILGEIKLGDHDALTRALNNNSKTEIVIGSQGGNVYEGLNIASTIQDREIPIIVPNNTICLSICAVIWLSAKPQLRIVGKKALLGTHSAWLTDNFGRPMPSESGNQLIKKYLFQRGYSERFISFLLSAPPEQMNWIEFEDLKRFGLSFHYLAD